ncbi:hypothetical protein R1sor_021503 [Riccia sorocarpa]|uniref:Uncharacterized protein n=1 Tax=Riccia sorocarpa TaxID=122646 RepID=A0ABD3GK75_9MARC
MSHNEEARRKKQDEDREDRALRRRVEKERRSRETREREVELKQKERNWNSPRPHWRPKSQNEDSQRSRSPKPRSLSEGDAALPSSSRSLSSSSQTEEDDEVEIQHEVINLDTPSTSSTPKLTVTPSAPVKETFLELLQKQSVRPLPQAWVRRNQPSQTGAGVETSSALTLVTKFPSIEDLLSPSKNEVTRSEEHRTFIGDLLEEEITRVSNLFDLPSPQGTNEVNIDREEETKLAEEQAEETALEEFNQGINPWSTRNPEDLHSTEIHEEVSVEEFLPKEVEEGDDEERRETAHEEEDLDTSLLYKEEAEETSDTTKDSETSSEETPPPLPTSQIFGSLRKVLQTVPPPKLVNPFKDDFSSLHSPELS